MQELNNSQVRQLIDVQQAFDASEETRGKLRRAYSGSMRWGERSGQSYLLRKQGAKEKSLGRRDPQTESIYKRFSEGREATKERAVQMRERLEEMAPINKAMKLARIPLTAARVLRHLADKGLLGRNVVIAGTNSLFLYEALAGVQLQSDLLSTGDVDLLFDARRHLRLSVFGEQPESILSVLRAADRSFEIKENENYRAVNRDGYMVDLIHPLNIEREQNPLTAKVRLSDATDAEDLVAVAIEGLQWLISAPKTEGIVIGDDGLPARMACVDPRVFALHKKWLSERINRSSMQRRRDEAQSLAAAYIATHYLGLKFDDPALTALPAALRDMSEHIERQGKEAYAHEQQD
ncbi:MAG: hypothetical protein HN403_18340 [Rhodospirillales bacterium]|jgi:hypothetical protein|nr:hypothetical protein [Rhodospirillales bacterium]